MLDIMVVWMIWSAPCQTYGLQEKGQTIDFFGVSGMRWNHHSYSCCCILWDMGSGPKAVEHQEWPSGW